MRSTICLSLYPVEGPLFLYHEIWLSLENYSYFLKHK
jgi:hypothetical protein